ncbi:CdvA-like protein [Candidatus Bathyarchaeota archaeon]|nr:CdvA-like protein [Candidatus Bathyarchaeota archaeon]
MSTLEERRIRCPNCGKMVPAMRYCIYCGTKLPQAPPTGAREVSFPSSKPAPPSTIRVRRPFFPGAKSEIEQLMSGITVLYERKSSLLDFFQSGEVSEKVFLKLYKEYSEKLNEYLKARAAKIDELKSSLEEKRNALSNIKMQLEELEVRTKIGEIDPATYSRQAEKLRIEERGLNETLNSLNADIKALENILGDKKPGEIYELERKLRKAKSALEKMGEEGKVAQETLKFVISDVEKMIGLLDSLIRDRKEKEKKLREELETLQTRYKLSELSIEEYERRKREIQSEIAKIWE